MRKILKQGSVEMFAVIVCILIIAFAAVVVSTIQKNKAKDLTEAVKNEAWLFQTA